MSIQTRQVEYKDGDILLEAYMAWDETSHDRRPGVLISHAWAGRTEFEEGKAEQLAELGYVGFALDLYGKGVKGSNPEQNSALMQPLLDDRVMLQRRMQLALEQIRKQKEVDDERVAAMGFCFGGLCVLDLARIIQPPWQYRGQQDLGKSAGDAWLGRPDGHAGPGSVAGR
jgi:dienelactone hydrolase